MIRFIAIFSFILWITGCGVLSSYKPTIEQGTIYTEETVQQLKIGMTKAQCAYILGNPILNSVYVDNRWNYVYTLKPQGSDELYQKYLVLFFNSDDRLVRMSRAKSSVVSSKHSDVPA
jgi:outer membrane protein assembly factor BamE